MEKSTYTSMPCSVNGLMIRTRAMVKWGCVGRKKPEEEDWNTIVNNVQCLPLEYINCKTKFTREKWNKSRWLWEPSRGLSGLREHTSYNSQPSVIPVSGNLIVSSWPCGYYMNVVHRHMQAKHLHTKEKYILKNVKIALEIFTA